VVGDNDAMRRALQRVLADDQKLQHVATADMDVEFFCEGKNVTLCAPPQKYYSTVPFTGMLGELVERLKDRYNVEVPLSDLFFWDTPAASLGKLDSAMNPGRDFVDEELCDHYAFRDVRT